MPLRSLESIADEEGIRWIKLKKYLERCHIPMVGTGTNLKVDSELVYQALLTRDRLTEKHEIKKQQDEKRYMQQLNERFYF